MEEIAIKNGTRAAFMQPSNDGGVWYEGLSKREYFAAIAMQGLLASTVGNDEFPDEKGFAREAVKMADALLLELAKPAKQ